MPVSSPDIEPGGAEPSVVPFPVERIRSGWLPNLPAARVAPKTGRELVDELNRAFADIRRIREPMEVA